MSSSILAGNKPVLQHISSILCSPVYNFWRPTGESTQIGYLLMQRMRLCWRPKVTSFLNNKSEVIETNAFKRMLGYFSSMLFSLGLVLVQSDLRLTPWVIYEYIWRILCNDGGVTCDWKETNWRQDWLSNGSLVSCWSSLVHMYTLLYFSNGNSLT